MKRLAAKFFVAHTRCKRCYIACSDLHYPGFYGTWELPDKNAILEKNPLPKDQAWDWLRGHRFVLVINDNMQICNMTIMSGNMNIRTVSF